MKFLIADTLHLRRACYALRAEEYGKYYNNIPEDYFCDDIDIMQLPNGDCLSTTVLIEEDDDVIATARVVFASYPDYNLIAGESFKLLNTDEEMISKLRQTSGVDNMTPIAEVGKLAVSHKYRDPKVIQYLFKGIGELAKARKIGLLIALIRPQIATLSRFMGISHIHFPEAHLDRSTYENMRYFFRFHDYFFPKLYKECPELFHDNLWEYLPYEELLQIANQHKDGAQLYWVTPEMILK
ncbi:MAG: hypothetical protein SFZ02_00515 [bacterium]|nr:hypothetical protein [bacterium]